jgi:predicted ATP-grasp superfamily ATP-dependent carboligase
MAKISIKRSQELHKIIRSIFQELEKNYVFFGLGVNAFNRLGPEFFIPHYNIISLRNPLENRPISKDIQIFSLETGAKGKHINAPRNSNTLLKEQRTQSYVKSFSNKQPVFIVYKSFPEMEKIAQKESWIIAANHYSFGKKLFENKIQFREVLKDIGLPTPAGEKINNPSLILKKWQTLKNKYGLPLVVQHPTRGGGRGTFFVNHPKELKRIIANLNEETLISKFIKGPSPSITGCVTPWGIAYTYPQYQVLDQPECYNLKTKTGNGLWCGHDWTFSQHKFSQKNLDEIYLAVVKVGEYLKSKGYKGIFGLDFIQDIKSKKNYIVECNPRLLGSFPVLTMVQKKNREIPILVLHILSFLKLNPRHYDIMRRIFDEILTLMLEEKTGAQLIIHNQTSSWSKNKQEIRPGVYKLENNRLIFKRNGYSLCHLREKREFLLSDGLPHKSSPFAPNRRIMRFIALNKVLKDYYHLTPWAHQAVKAAYNALNMKPVRLVNIRKIFNKDFMAKG